MKENEIRPKEIFEEYLRLSRLDAEAMDRSDLVDVQCVACGSEASREHLRKNDFQYHLCDECGSLYCNPRPSEAALDKLYENSESARFWATRFFPAVAEARREKLFRPKAEQVKALCDSAGLTIETICDVGAGYGIFLEELAKVFPGVKLYGVEPSPELSERCREAGIETFEGMAEDSGEWAGRFDLVISSEVIEHVFTPRRFVEAVARLVRPGGHMLLTGLGYEGFDILTLQEKSNSIFPPHHINFISIAGFERLFTACGLTDVAVHTPGKLDVDIVRNSGQGGEFFRVLAERGEEAIADLQALLVKHKLSSHIWALAKKPEEG
ncbi:MAG: class I SAM-dependent methyltransferase [bacterium]|nr:class I SAM-dependent methyltransferase [bacterium]